MGRRIASLIALLFYILTLTGDPCIKPTAPDWRRVLETVPWSAYVMPPTVYPFVVVYEDRGRVYVFVSNDDNAHGRCMMAF